MAELPRRARDSTIRLAGAQDVFQQNVAQVMNTLHPFDLKAVDGKLIRGDRFEGSQRQILFMTGFLSKRWGNKSKALAQWCQDQGWGFCCYDVRGFGDSEGSFTDYT